MCFFVCSSQLTLFRFHPSRLPRLVGARSGFPPLRIFQAKHLQAQLELNAVHWLCREMHLDSWRKKVILPEALRWAGFGVDLLGGRACGKVL